MTLDSFVCTTADLAQLVLDKCTHEKNDRDDVGFQMSFDYEFVEDFYVERPIEDSTTPPPTGGVRFSGGRRGSWEGVPPGMRRRRGEGEAGETAVVELRDVTVVEEGKAEEEEEEEEKDYEMSRLAQTDEDGYVVLAGSPPPLSVVYIADVHGCFICCVLFVRKDEWKPREYDKRNHVLNIMVSVSHSNHIPINASIHMFVTFS